MQGYLVVNNTQLTHTVEKEWCRINVTDYGRANQLNSKNYT